MASGTVRMSENRMAASSGNARAAAASLRWRSRRSSPGRMKLKLSRAWARYWQIAACLAHQPDRRVVGGLAAQGAQELVVLKRCKHARICRPWAGSGRVMGLMAGSGPACLVAPRLPSRLDPPARSPWNSHCVSPERLAQVFPGLGRPVRPYSLISEAPPEDARRDTAPLLKNSSWGPRHLALRHPWPARRGLCGIRRRRRQAQAGTGWRPGAAHRQATVLRASNACRVCDATASGLGQDSIVLAALRGRHGRALAGGGRFAG